MFLQVVEARPSGNREDMQFISCPAIALSPPYLMRMLDVCNAMTYNILYTKVYILSISYIISMSSSDICKKLL